MYTHYPIYRKCTTELGVVIVNILFKRDSKALQGIMWDCWTKSRGITAGQGAIFIGSKRMQWGTPGCESVPQR